MDIQVLLTINILSHFTGDQRTVRTEKETLKLYKHRWCEKLSGETTEHSRGIQAVSGEKSTV